MINTVETEFFILSEQDYHVLSQDAKELNVSLDYLLFEFCDIQGEQVSLN